MNIYSLARQFQLKLAVANVDYFDSKKKSIEEIKSQIERMADLVKGSKELREAIFTFPADPFVTFGDNAKSAIESLKEVVSGVLYLQNNLDSVDETSLVNSLLSIFNSIKVLANSSGSDKWGIMRERYLSVLEIFGDYYTSQGAYGDKTKLNPMIKRELERKLGSLTNTLDMIANSLKNPRKTGCLDILKNLSGHGLLEDEKIEFLVENVPSKTITERVTRKLENHEKEQILLYFGDVLGLDKLGLMPNINIWNKYVAPSEKLLSDVFRSWLRSPDVGSRKLEDGEMIGPALKGKKKILSRTTVYKLLTAAKEIKELKLLKDQEEKLSAEKMFGSPDVDSPIKPKQDVRKLIDRLSGMERALWNKIPIPVQIKVLNRELDLHAVLEVADHHADELVGAKFDAALFENLN